MKKGNQIKKNQFQKKKKKKKKKRDLSDCNNYYGISLINVGLKIISQRFVTNRIDKYALNHIVLLDSTNLDLEIKKNV